MLRKSSALMFMMAMALLIALKHPVLGYCLCLDSYFAGNCACQMTTVDQDTSAPQSHSCCIDCSDHIAASTDSSTVEQKPLAPCNDCKEHFKIDVGDFVWQSTDKLSDDTGASNTTTASHPPGSFSLQAQTLVHNQSAIRGDPPSMSCRDGEIPLYLRHLVLRL
ncbi:MAG: hypothetical protein KJO79_06760 [Verrucomicrobiae bacterium]|nr:hypothetical protein [Verrucomicrobiae bacterium]NNJ86861.1 hypothetical protein [Akkermansiaceae bacterium]